MTKLLQSMKPVFQKNLKVHGYILMICILEKCIKRQSGFTNNPNILAN